MIKTVAKVVVAGVAVAATAEILRRTGVIQKIADKVQDMASDVLLRQFVEDNTPEGPGDDFAPTAQDASRMFR